MNLIRCDRCNAELPHKDWRREQDRDVDHERAARSLRLFRPHTPEERERGGSDMQKAGAWDLCPKCADDVIAWIARGR